MIKCPHCKESKEFILMGKTKEIVVVNEQGSITNTAGEYTYKCTTCSTTFSCNTAPTSPSTAKILHG